MLVDVKMIDLIPKTPLERASAFVGAHVSVATLIQLRHELDCLDAEIHENGLDRHDTWADKMTETWKFLGLCEKLKMINKDHLLHLAPMIDDLIMQFGSIKKDDVSHLRLTHEEAKWAKEAYAARKFLEVMIQECEGKTSYFPKGRLFDER